MYVWCISTFIYYYYFTLGTYNPCHRMKYDSATLGFSLLLILLFYFSIFAHKHKAAGLKLSKGVNDCSGGLILRESA